MSSLPTLTAPPLWFAYGWSIRMMTEGLRAGWRTNVPSARTAHRAITVSPSVSV